MRYWATVAKVVTLAFATTTPVFAKEAATLSVATYVPVRCDAALASALMGDRVMVLSVHRTCNTGHAVAILGREVEGLGDVIITESRTGRTRTGSDAVFAQPDGYFSGTDQFTITAKNSSREALLQYGQSLTVRVEVL